MTAVCGEGVVELECNGTTAVASPLANRSMRLGRGTGNQTSSLADGPRDRCVSETVVRRKTSMTAVRGKGVYWFVGQCLAAR